MRRPSRLVLLVAALAMGSPAAAQTRPAPRPRPTLSDRVFVSINGSYRVGSDDFSDRITFRENAEDGRFDTNYTVSSGPAFDLSGGAVVWRNLGIGVGATRFSRSTSTIVAGSVPHPFFFDRPRTISGDVTGLKHEEIGLHVQARGVFPVRNRLQVMVFGGPSFFRLKQGIVNDVDFSETYPFDVATFRQAVTSTAIESTLGFNVGGDIGYFFTRQLGVGFGAQFAGTTVETPSPGGGTINVKVGGVQAGGGLRLRF